MSPAEEIDAIIARAMSEYNTAHNIVDETIPTPEPEPPIVEELADQTAIPENSDSVLVEETTSRFSSAIWYENIQRKTITVAGVGGIGSWCALLLSRMHPDYIVLFDDDVVEAVNMSGQLYTTDDIGVRKVDAIAGAMSKYSDYHRFITYASRFTAQSPTTDIMICGFDNMEARKTFFEAWLQHQASYTDEQKAKCLYIDARLAAEEFQVFAIQGNDTRAIQTYLNEWLFSDGEADETICSYKQTSFCANMVASVMVNLFVNFAANECNPLVPRDVPFFTSYNAETMFFKVIQ